MTMNTFVDPRDLKEDFNSRRLRDKDHKKNKKNKKKLDPYRREKLRW